MRPRLRRLALLALIAGLVLFVGTLAAIWHATSTDLQFLVSAVQHAPQPGEIIYHDAEGVMFDHETSGVSYRSLGFSAVDVALNEDLIALEDKNFARHHGVDFLRTLRAGIYFVFAGRRQSAGGSTLTQQLIKNLLMHHERTLIQKAKEILLALRLERALSTPAAESGPELSETKRQILAAYWNHLFVAHRHRGLRNFAERVLKKPASGLSADERVAVLAIVRSPAAYLGTEEKFNEHLGKIGAALRRVGRRKGDEVGLSLRLMRQWHQNYAQLLSSHTKVAGAIQPRTSLAKSIGNLFNLHATDRPSAFAATHVRTQRISRLDDKLQQKLEGRLAKLNKGLAENCSVTGAYLLLRLSDAAVIAAGEDSCSQFNELVQAKRQVSSTIKPFLYAYAFETLALNPASILDDRRFSVVASDGSLYAPGNHYKTFRGKMHLKNALQISANTISLQLFAKVNKAEFSRRLARVFARYPRDEVGHLLHADYSLALGTIDLSPVHVASAYLALLKSGRKAYPHWGRVVSGIDPHFTRVLPADENNAEIFDAVAADQVREMLTAVLRPEGTGGEFIGAHDAMVIQELGAKSGSGPVDTWFVGYSQDVLLLVWLGFRQRSAQPRDFHAATLWYDLYRETLPWFRPKPMAYGPGVERRYFCAETGLPPTPGCRRIASALFRR